MPLKALLFAALLSLMCGLPAPASAQTVDPGQVGQRAATSTPSLRVAMVGEPSSLDPALADDPASHAILDLLTEGLLKMDVEGRLIPGVAVEEPTVEGGGVSPDGLVYSYRLREDAAYSDGSPVVASDFEEAIKRTLDPAVKSPSASLYYCIKGAQQYRESGAQSTASRSLLRDAVGIRAVDDHTLRVVLKEPRATFNYLMALWPARPIHHDTMELLSTEGSDGLAANPDGLIGNGPFRLAEWTPGQRLILESSNPSQTARTGLGRIEISFASNARSALERYRKGDLDLVTATADLLPDVSRDAGLAKELVRFPTYGTTALLFNERMRPFNNPAVRRAFSIATNRDDFILRALKGLGRAAYQWIPPDMQGHQVELDELWRFNAEWAPEVLANAGYPNGEGLPPIRMLALQGDDSWERLLQKYWMDTLGVEVAIQTVDEAGYAAALRAGTHQMSFIRWSADYPSPENWLPFFATDNRFSGGDTGEPDTDALIARGMSEPDDTRRAAIWAQLQRTVVERADAVFLFHDELAVLAKPYLRGLAFGPMDSPVLPGFRSYGSITVETRP